MPRADQSVRASFAWPAALTLVLLAPVLFTLLQSVPGRVEQPLATLAPGAQPGTVRLLGAPHGGAADRYIAYRLKLTARDIGRVVSHSRIDLLTTSHGVAVRLRSAEIAVTGTECAFKAQPGTAFPTNDYLPFVRGSGCVPLRGTATGDLELTVSVADIARLELLTFLTPADAPPDHTPLHVLVAGDPAHVRAVRGRLIDVYPERSARRVQLLNYVWQVSSSVTWIWIAFGIAAVLLMAGNLVLWAPASFIDAGRAAPLVRGSAAAALAGGLALLYAIVTPPFQGPDEPNHFVGFTTFVGRPELDREAAQWARVTHFERIQFHVHEKFGPADMDRLGPFWNDGGYPEPSIRGAGVHFVWRTIAPGVARLPAPELFLALRLLNAVLFAGAVCCFVALAVLLTDVSRPSLLAFPLFFVPTIPFFAMHVSNHALLLCAYLVIGLGILVWFLDGKRSDAAGALIGAAWAAAILISRSAVPLVPVVAAVAVARILMGGRDQRGRSTAIFWAGLAIPATGMMYVADPGYLDAMFTMAGSAAVAIGGALGAIRNYPWLIAIGAGLAGVAERLAQVLRRRFSTATPSRLAIASVWTMRAAAAAIVAFVIASPFLDLPVLATVDPAQPPPPGDYALRTLLATLTMFRLAAPDFLTSWSFWGGFGWLDTLVDWRIVSALVVATAGSLCALLLWIARRQDPRHAALLIFIIAGFAGSIGAYAFSVITLTPADVHGRYLAGAYLCLLFVSWSPLAVLPIRRTWIPALACMAVHGYCLTLILRRYF